MSNLSDKAFFLTQDLEINIRGRYLRFSASVEGLMTKCIIYLNEVKTKASGIEEPIDFMNFTFSKKEVKFKALLEQIYIDLFQANTTLFEHLSKFRDMRNKMAHCYFTWDETDLSYLTIWDLENKKDRPHKIVPTKHSMHEISDLLNQSVKAITNDLNNVALEVVQRVTPEIPYMFEA
ncbi:MAG: hypothetical protein JSS98_00045 [Bacteroidetes bacterium]|nr:hypothetical protein [Bacteroidota bacterium]